MKKISILVLLSFLLSSCASAEVSPTPVKLPAITLTPVLSPTVTATETPLPTLTPTSTLSPDLNRYECAENVSQADCDFVKEGIRLARYFFVNNFGSDILRGVKVVVVNDPNDISRGEGGSAGTFNTPRDGEPYVWINVGHPFWVEYAAPEFQSKNIGLVVHEFTHAWQWQHGCLTDRLNNPASPTAFLIQGYAEYASLIVSGVDLKDEMHSDERALGFWQASEWNETRWFDNTDVNAIVVKHMVEEYGIGAYAEFCESVGSGTQPNDAFESVYGLSIFEYRQKIMDEVLGALKDCTVATCGAGVDVYSGKYKLGHLLDPTKTTPNLIVKFVDQNNEPVVLTHVHMFKQGTDSFGEYAQPFVIPGIFSKAMFLGRYAFWFCPPGYPTDANTFNCGPLYETSWFDVVEDQVTELTFQLPPATANPNHSSPNFVATFLDKNGNPIPNLDTEICSYESPVRICDSGGQTDLNGVFKDSLRSGQYLVRAFIIGAEWPTEMQEIIVNDSGVTEVTFKFPQPNLIVKLTDANGAGVPEHELVLCKIVNGTGDCNTTEQFDAAGRKGLTNQEGIFETLVEPGEYYILTCKIACHLNPPDYNIEGIIVTSETEVTTVEFQLYK